MFVAGAALGPPLPRGYREHGAAAATAHSEADQEWMELGDFQYFLFLSLFKTGEFGSYSRR